MEATEHRERPHFAHTARMRRGCCGIAGDLLPDPLVRPVLVVVGHVLPEHAPQVGPAQYQDVIQAFAPDAAEGALARGVMSRCPVRGPQLRDAARRRDAGDRRTILAVAIMDEIARPMYEGRGLAQMLCDSVTLRV